MTSSSSNTSLTLAGCFLAGVTSAVVVGSLFGQRGKKSGSSVAFSDNKKSSTCAKVPEELRREQLSRHGLYFGNEGLDLIRSSNVCVVGLGGVGSHCALMLARGGVERLRLIDFDQVTLSSLNRHACATLKDVGISKVECVKNTCMELGLAPEHIDACVEMYTKETGPDLLSMPKKGDTIGENQKWDVVIDCIDDVPTKAALLTYCIRNKIRVLSCMGAGGKSDMTRLHISDLRTSAKDPLASKLRQTIKKTMKQFDADRKEGNGDKDSASGVDDSYLDDMDQLTIIFSSEKTVAKLADLTEEQKTEADKSQFGAVDGMRIRVLPVLGPMPAIMGQSLAAITLCELGKKQIQNPVTGERIGRNIRHKIFQQYGAREKKIASGQLKIAGGASYTGPIEIDSDDVEYLYGVWRNRCAVTGAKIGAVLGLVRWDTSKPATVDNLVLMSRPAQQRYDEKGKSSIDPKVRARIEQRLAACRDLSYDM